MYINIVFYPWTIHTSERLKTGVNIYFPESIVLIKRHFVTCFSV